ncbi:hypothetical protein DAPPUDRAFT_255321 [Daphnia pulex]|uniref:BTB domain-containing protein n=1 Tax=Daphnia pulex TaxID=6669 RepID=E9H8Y8_DAPPU|nr:hypothetical protein DAPPUDRAFT_255321 [Daphnia pulex]|eukprot:EFX71805.1 hypothetical protein DAPPUDRAFT_255321 [Daphnia pulex]
MISGLLEKFHSQTQCDVNFKFKGGQSIGAHIIILSAASPVFTAMFQSDLKESQTHEVIIEDIDFQVFIHFLEYLYSCRVSKLAKDEHFVQTINLLCQAADKYFVEDLKHEFEFQSHLIGETCQLLQSPLLPVNDFEESFHYLAFN